MRRAAIVLTAMVVAGCGGGGAGGGGDPVQGTAPNAPERITLSSPAFREGGTIPTRFTCDGAGASPPLRWSGVPADAKELLLLMEDPDAPNGTFVHWIVAHIPPSSRGMPAGRVPAGAVQLQQSFGKSAYGGPCPPEDDPPHHYVLSLYSLDRKLAVTKADSPDEVRSKLKRAARARGQLRATYGR
jgi:Raf kinase inhibitor-like YbhB/YbcL family protein